MAEKASPRQGSRVGAKKKLLFFEWECPECTAQNPFDDGFSFGDEVFCSWCGQVFGVRQAADGEKFKLVLQ
jgi:hypothetical protein